MEEKSVIIFYRFIMFLHTEKTVNRSHGAEQKRKMIHCKICDLTMAEIITFVITKTNEVNFQKPTLFSDRGCPNGA